MPQLRKLKGSLSIGSIVVVGALAYLNIGINGKNLPEQTPDNLSLTTTEKAPATNVAEIGKNFAAVGSEHNPDDTDNNTDSDQLIAESGEPEWENTLGSIDGKRLSWSPEPILVTGKVFDLCDDEQAIEAGFDGGDLSGDRQNMGIDCEISANRYGLITSGGQLNLSDSSSLDDSNLKEDVFAADEETNLPPDASLLLGYQGPNHANVDISTLDVGRVVVLPNTVNNVAGATYGLLANTSSKWASNVSIQAGSAYYEHPLSLQPGETAPFFIETSTDIGINSGVTTNASLSENIDINRSILVTGAPGNWQGDIENLPVPEGLIDKTQYSGVVRYYQTNLEIAQPTNTAQVPLTSIEDVEVVVSFFSNKGVVTQIINPPAMRVDVNGVATQHTSLVAGDMMTIGFIIPDGVVDFGIWVGGGT